MVERADDDLDIIICPAHKVYCDDAYIQLDNLEQLRIEIQLKNLSKPLFHDPVHCDLNES